MLGYMNADALAKTLDTKKVTFYSRSKDRLWTKGETSGNWLDFVSAEMDCDADTILIQARPHGPACHTGSRTCFNDNVASATAFLDQLSGLIAASPRHASKQLYDQPISRWHRVLPKVGEEGSNWPWPMKNDPERPKTKRLIYCFI